MNTAPQIVVVHGPGSPSLNGVLSAGGLRRAMIIENMAVWVFDGSSPSPAVVGVAPVAPAGPERLLLTIAQAAAVLGVGRTTAYELVRAGVLPVVHVGRCSRVVASVLPEVVERLRTDSAASGRTACRRWVASSHASSQAGDTLSIVAERDGSQPPAATTARPASPAFPRAPVRLVGR